MPGIALYLALFIYPTVTGFYYSLTDWDGLSPSYQFVGADNYANVAKDIIFRKSIVNNIKFMVAVVIVQTVVSLLLALQLSKQKKVNVALRSLFCSYYFVIGIRWIYLDICIRPVTRSIEWLAGGSRTLFMDAKLAWRCGHCHFFDCCCSSLGAYWTNDYFVRGGTPSYT